MDELIEAWIDDVPGLRAKLIAGLEVLDLECGLGEVAIAIKRAFPRCRVTAFDRRRECIALARLRAQRGGGATVHFAVMDWEVAAIQGFDLVVTEEGRVDSRDREALRCAVSRMRAPDG